MAASAVTKLPFRIPQFLSPRARHGGSLHCHPRLAHANRLGLPWAQDLPSADGPSARVNENLDSLPAVLSTWIVPPISPTSCLEIASPSPVPPYRRVVEASA